MRKTRSEIIIETSEVYVFIQKRRFVRAWCEDCGREVSLIPPSEAALLAFQETEKIYSLMDEKRLHFQVFSGQNPFICLTSLGLI